MSREEGEPFLNINYDGEVVHFGRRNTALFKYLGEWATHDHIFIICEPEEEDDISTGFYIFKDNESYDVLAEFMVQNEFPLHLNLPEPLDMDKDAFDASHYNDLRNNGFVPEDWKNLDE